MKVLHICSFYQPLGGAEKLLFSVLDLLEQRGVENVVLAPMSQSGGATGRRREHFVDFLEYPFERSSLFASLRDNTRLMSAVTKLLGDERPDVIHLHNQQNPFIYKACSDSGIPMVRNLHDPRLYCPTNWRLLPDGSLCPYPFGRACLTQGCVKPTPAEVKHIAVMAWNRHLSFTNTTLIIESRESYELALQNGYTPEQMCLIPNCTAVPPSEEQVAADKARACVPGGNQLLFVGRASREKGLPFLLHALTRVRHDFTLNLLTAGDYFHHEIAPLITRLGLESKVNVRLNTSYADTARYYAAADAVIVPSVRRVVRPLFRTAIPISGSATPRTRPMWRTSGATSSRTTGVAIAASTVFVASASSGTESARCAIVSRSTRPPSYFPGWRMGSPSCARPSFASTWLLLSTYTSPPSRTSAPNVPALTS